MVIGATGNVGSHILSRMSRDGLASIRALVRPKDNRKSVLASNIEVREGDLTDRASLQAALDGTNAVMLMWPLLTSVGAHGVLDAIADGERRLVYLSSVGVGITGSEDDPIFRMHGEIEELIAQTGVARTILRSDTIASNTLGWAEQIRASGVVKGPLTAATAVVDPRDIAAVATAALTNAEHSGKTYLLTGPRVISRPEQVRAIGAAIGRALRFEQIEVDQARQQMLHGGMQQGLVDALLAAAEKRAASTLVAPDIAAITGERARSFEQWALDHADAFR
ncbi:nucleoside-diphosphate sugar epimerase [Salmonella enterica subsp. enterica serovar Virchow]|nr:nucleoside-diphosphate sugar epimerase [Salmonella enterica subsp. enterica serovar Virchow]EBW2250049.1 NAD-dependent epimerase/dehydratase family protein [Salmonella enterica subsp. enterica serovar Enteritidis]EFG6100893.1 NmrA family NAD(P)-binding protein [Escherichia coli]EBW2353280.1 NAD-dependent epimerase/dehydratase family protein [Salmonella enterica subsp. enterica serovar Enteritidis]EFG8199795.1 NmrA family NAD(P)-binding protein [Escherichia coli]